MSRPLPSNIMISYRSADFSFVKKLVAYLRSREVDPWLDREGIRPGKPWRDVLLDKLRTCDACIVVLSPDYLASEHCRMEVFVARSFGRKIIPIMRTDCFAQLRSHEETKGLEDLFMVRMRELDAFGLPVSEDEAFGRVLSGALGTTRSPAASDLIYVSYSTEDAQLATDLSLALEKLGEKTWVATRHIAVGENWRDAQARAMMAARAHVVILDQDIVTRDVLRTEILLAEARGLPVYTVLPKRLHAHPKKKARMLDSLTNSDLTYRRLAAVQFFPSARGAKRLAGDLADVLREQPAKPARSRKSASVSPPPNTDATHRHP